MNHALLGPSGAHRWMECPPSARFSEQFEDKESEYAKEGTAAHELAEITQLILLGDNDGADIELAQEFCTTNPYYNAEMEDAVNFYIDILQERFALLSNADSSSVWLPETKVNFSAWVPEGFGTSDTVFIGNRTIEVIDLKYGKGVPVDAVNNPQLRLYALGAYNAFKILYDIDTINMTIVQPRLGSVSTDSIRLSDLLSWAETEVKPRAQLAWDGGGEYSPGGHCRFCKAKAECRALSDYNLELAKYEFKLPHNLSTTDLSDILKRLDMFDIWIKAIKEHTLKEALKGVKYDGFKVVAGRSVRKIHDPDVAVDILVENGNKKEMLYKPPELLGITALEKLVGKKKFMQLLDSVIEKAPGKPALVPEGDKRQEINSLSSAEEDFK